LASDARQSPWKIIFAASKCIECRPQYIGRRRKFVDFAMILAGLGISLCRALPPDAADIFIRSLDEMTDRNVSPAEAHIFRAVVVEARLGLAGQPRGNQRLP
jgi:hypothetical protein